MNIIDLIYHIAVFLMAILVLFLDINAPGTLLKLLLQIIAKVVPILMIGYSMIHIFKYYSIL